MLIKRNCAELVPVSGAVAAEIMLRLNQNTAQEVYAVNELPHPQLRVACGFWNTNPCFMRSS